MQKRATTFETRIMERRISFLELDILAGKDDFDRYWQASYITRIFLTR